MKNLSFVIWMLFYPFINGTLSTYIETSLSHKTYSDTTIVISSLINLTIYFYVGYLLYEPKNSK